MGFGKKLIGALGLVALVATATTTAMAAEKTVEPLLNDDGLHTQAWFIESFLDLREDLVEAAAEGKRFAVIWEQRGCPYCRETHTVNFARKDINEFAQKNFAIVQLNLWGDREVTDFDGEVMTEKKLASKWGVVFTPTMHFFVEEKELKDGVPGHKQTAASMPGYYRPFHFLAMFEWVKNRRYDNLHFQKYIAEKSEKLRASGKPVNMW